LVLKSPAEIAIMDEANGIVRSILVELEGYVRPGRTTMDIDDFVEQRIREAGGVPAFKGYPNPSGGSDFPGSACTSVNEEIVHGVPSPRVVLNEGDVVSVDIGVVFRGYYGDGASTFPVGQIDERSSALLRVTNEALDLGLDQARVGNRVSDIGHAVQKHVEANGFSIVRDFVGHGIGSQLHEEPQIPNFGEPGHLQRLVAGMVLAIEPMVAAGRPDVDMSARDGWTARTRDRSRAAHFEKCVAVTDAGPTVLGVARGA
jgi:methionyl aminopeptidase